MSKTKAQTKSNTTKAASAPMVQKLPETPEKEEGMAQSDIIAKKMADQDMPAGGTASRAQMMRSLQASVGNHQLSRMTEKPMQTKMRVTHPQDASEKEAEQVAQQVTSGNQVGEITPLRGRSMQEAGQRNPLDEGSARWSQRQDQRSGQLDVSAAETSMKQSGPGNNLNPAVQSRLEAGMGADLSQTRVHQDKPAQDAAGALNARAFTRGKDIYLGANESPNDVSLMAHETTHVVQQGAASPIASRASHQPEDGETVSRNAAPTLEGKQTGPAVVPGKIDLKGLSSFPVSKIDPYADERGRAQLNATFGQMASGMLQVEKRKETYQLVGGKKRNRQMLPINGSHPLVGALGVSLVVHTEKSGNIKGHIGFKKYEELNLRAFTAAPEKLGLPGFELKGRSPKPVNKLEDGALQIGLDGVKVRLGQAFEGSLTMIGDDEKITRFSGVVNIKAKGAADGELNLVYLPDKGVTGKGKVGLKLPKNFSGELEVAWDGVAISGMGKVGYQGEKMSGEVIIRLIDIEEAKRLEAAKKAPPKEGGDQPTSAQKNKHKKGKINYALFGEGDLTFNFTEWLNGTAHVIVDPVGHVTIIGKITPQKEFILFEQQDYVKDLFKVEARAAYGVPVVGNIFIFANIGMDAFAKIGPGKFHKMEVAGTYSTDPKKNKDFSIRGSLNVSAAAGMRLRGEAGAGLEILSHDIKAGAGINAIAGIQGYAEATPIIGYREKGAEVGDKKGEFFIRGDLEMAARPFLGLGGDLFVELDSPWWSPAPDKKWTWPLGSKEYPLGGELGVKASVDYVFGSDQLPSIEIKPAQFSADKFLTDLYTDKARSKSGEKKSPGDWKEKNSQDAAPPKGEKKGDAKPGKAEGDPKTAKSQKLDSQLKKKKASDKDRTADGKTVEAYKTEASKKGNKKPKKSNTKDSGAKVSEGKDSNSKDNKTDNKKEKWEKGVKIINQALAYSKKEGIDLDELNRILRSIKKRKEIGFSQLYAKDNGDFWTVIGSMSPPKPVAEARKKDDYKGPLYLPNGYDVRANLYDRGSRWSKVKKEVKAEGEAENTTILEKILTKDEKAAKKEIDYWIKTWFIFNTDVEKLLAYKDRKTRAEYYAKKYVTKDTLYEVDHNMPLAQHWVQKGFNSDDNSRWNATHNKDNLIYMTRYWNRHHSSLGYYFNDKLYIGSKFKSINYRYKNNKHQILDKNGKWKSLKKKP